MGSVFGGRLAMAGHDVTLVDPWDEHMAAVSRSGLVLELPDGSHLSSNPAATTDAVSVRPVDVVIVLTKGFATRAAAESIRGAVTPDTWVVTLQNGLGLDAVLAEVLASGRVVPGTTTVGAEMVEPGRSRMTPFTAEGRAVSHFGLPRGSVVAPEELLTVAELLTEAGLPTEVITDADEVIWTKLAMAATMAPLCTVLRCRIGAVWHSEVGRPLVRRIFDEIVAVAMAEGVELDVASVWEHCAKTWDGAPAHFPSMTVDAMNGRQTEIEFFSIEIARRAQLHGLSAPITATLGSLVTLGDQESRERGPQHQTT